MVITIASMKGGVGKTTIAAMMARYISDKRGSTVVVIDLDPQRGATIILLGTRKGASISPPTIYDILQSELTNMPSTEIFAQAMRKSPYSDKIFVVPSNGDLARILEEDTPPDLLRYALDESPLSKDVTVIVDAGSRMREILSTPDNTLDLMQDGLMGLQECKETFPDFYSLLFAYNVNFQE